VLRPSLCINDCFISCFLIVLSVIILAPVTGSADKVVVLIEHCKIGAPSCGPLLDIRARSDGLDCHGNLGNGLPLANLLAPIIFDSLEAVGNTFIWNG